MRCWDGVVEVMTIWLRVKIAWSPKDVIDLDWRRCAWDVKDVEVGGSCSSCDNGLCAENRGNRCCLMKAMVFGVARV